MDKSTKKTIFFYTDTHFYGGAENQMYLLAKFLDKEKYSVTLICSDFEKLKNWTDKFESEGIEVIKLSVFHKHDPRHYSQLKEIIKNRKIDILHIHMWNPASCRYALMLANKYNLPTIVTEHDPFELTGFKGYIKSKLIRNIQKIITVSDTNNKVVSHLFPSLAKKIVTIHNGIDCTWFKSQLLGLTEGKIKEFREKIFEINEDYKIILTVAELHERKGIKYLIKAMSGVLEENNKIKLIIVGNGPKYNELKQLAMEEGVINNVLFLGFRKDIPQLMASSDLFVLPSKKEAFGLVLLEAGITRLPIIASKTGGIPEIIENGINGVLIPPENPKKLTRSILEIFNDDFKRNSYIEEGYKKVKNSFDAKIMAKKTQEVYDEVLNNQL